MWTILTTPRTSGRGGRTFRRHLRSGQEFSLHRALLGFPPFPLWNTLPQRTPLPPSQQVGCVCLLLQYLLQSCSRGGRG